MIVSCTYTEDDDDGDVDLDALEEADNAEMEEDFSGSSGSDANNDNHGNHGDEQYQHSTGPDEYDATAAYVLPNCDSNSMDIERMLQ